MTAAANDVSQYQALDFYCLDDLLSPADRQLRDGVRRWVQSRYLPVVAQHYRDGTFPLELMPEMGQMGLLGAHLSGYGCAGRNSLQYGLAMQELERGDSGLRTVASVQGALAMQAIHAYGSEAQKQRWLPSLAKGTALGCFGLTEPDHGSDPSGMTSTANRHGDGFVLNGQKMWIGHGTVCDVAIVWAKLAGEPGVDGTSASAIRGFLVEKNTPGFRAELIEGKLSFRAALTARLQFADCRLPADSLLPLAQGLKAPLGCLNHARYGIAWGVIGAAQACFDEVRQYVLSRRQFGRSLASFQLVQRKLALMLAEITKAQLLAFRLAQLKDAGQATHQQISLAKMNNVATALDVARTCRDMLGAVGILDQYQTFRHMCNLESVKTYEGTEDIHLLALGQAVTGIPAFGG